MSEIQNENKGIKAPHPTPPPSLRVPDHPHPTIQEGVEVVRNRGTGLGGVKEE